jgi:hypothetical protein
VTPNPDLVNTNTQTAPIAVSPLAAGVQREPGAPPPQAPLPNIPVAEDRYFFCTVPTASMHRTDGKRLPFIHGFLKTNIEADISFLDNEIRGGNIYVRRATADEINHAKLVEDPMGAVRQAVKEELENTYSLEDLEKLLEKRRATIASGGSTKPAGDAGKLAGVDVNRQASIAIQAAGVTQHAAHSGATTASLAGLIKRN